MFFFLLNIFTALYFKSKGGMILRIDDITITYYMPDIPGDFAISYPLLPFRDGKEMDYLERKFTSATSLEDLFNSFNPGDEKRVVNKSIANITEKLHLTTRIGYTYFYTPEDLFDMKAKFNNVPEVVVILYDGRQFTKISFQRTSEYGDNEENFKYEHIIAEDQRIKSNYLRQGNDFGTVQKMAESY